MPYPQLQKHMWSPELTLDPMVMEDTMMGLRYLVKSDLNFIKKSNLNMESSNTMGFRVSMVDHMYLCAVGLRPNDHALTSRDASDQRFRDCAQCIRIAHNVK